MKDDRQTAQRPRVRPRPTALDAAPRKASPQASPKRAPRPAASSPKRAQRPLAPDQRPERSAAPRPKKGPTASPRSTQADRARHLYPDDGYYAPRNARRPPIKKGKRRPRNRWGRSFGYSAVAILFALLAGFLVQSFLFQIIVVSGDAMHMVLNGNEWVVVTKYDYWSEAPKRGDIVAVSTSTGLVIRRVVGMPDETLSIDQHGDTLINGDPLGEPYVFLKSYDEFPPTELPVGRYFVLCDNRTVSYDSRDPAIGVVTRQKIVGKVKSILYPFDKSGSIQ